MDDPWCPHLWETNAGHPPVMPPSGHAYGLADGGGTPHGQQMLVRQVGRAACFGVAEATRTQRTRRRRGTLSDPEVRNMPSRGE